MLRWACMLAAGAAVMFAGCKSREPVKPPDAALLNPPTFAELAANHNRRVELLDRTYSQGVIEIRWTDERGEGHFQQGDVEMWIDLPHHTAFRVDKLGEVFLWLGSDNEHYWLFDRLSEVKTLYVGRHDEPPLAAKHAAVSIKPLAWLDLLALSPMKLSDAENEASVKQPEVTYDVERDAWIAESQGIGGPVRLFFDRLTQLPERVELLDNDGQAYIESDLDRYQSVPVPNIAVPSFPKLAELVVLRGREDLAVGQVKIALNSSTARVDDQPFDRVFDLARLMKSLKIDRVEGELASRD